MVGSYRFWTKTGVAVVLRPETEEQHERVHDMGRMWAVNKLWNCGTHFIVDFVEQHDIKYAYQFVI